MDTELDVREQTREEYLGANEKDFLNWIFYNTGVRIIFHDLTSASEKVRLMMYLKSEYWNDYMNDIVDAVKVDFEKVRSIE